MKAGTSAAAPTRWRMARTVEATLEAVDALCGHVRRRLKNRLSPADWYGVELLLREALTNAVLHGARPGRGRQVRCEVQLGLRTARLVVADGGPGFDWRAALAARTPEAAVSGRGLKIYELYADRVLFNQSGNRVVLERRLEGPAAGEVR